MGWLFIENTTRRDLIDQLIKTEESERYHWETLKHCARGNVLWTVSQRSDKQTNEVTRFLGCHLLQRHVEQRYGRKVTSWGYKSMDESMHPLYYSCPLSYLQVVPVENEAWRAKVRQYHRKYRVGDRLTLEHCQVPHLVVTSVKPLIGTYNGARYRVPRDLVMQVN